MSIVLEDNIFSNSADNGGGGGGVEIVETFSKFLLNGKNNFEDKEIATDYNFAIYSPGWLFFEEDRCIFCTAPYGSSDKRLVLYKTSIDLDTTITPNRYKLKSTTESYISLDFGQTYSSIPANMSQRVAVSPDKTKVVVTRQASPYNTIYVVPLSKNNDTYSFGTVVSTVGIAELSSATSVSWVRFLNNNTFVVSFIADSKSSICVCQIGDDNTVSVVKTISVEDLNIGTTNISLLEIVNGLVLLVDTNTKKINFIDIDNESVVYSETSATNLQVNSSGAKKILVYENKVFILITNSANQTPFLVYSVTNNTVTKNEFTVSSGTAIPISTNCTCFRIFYADTNVVSIAITNGSSLANISYDFQNLILYNKQITNTVAGVYGSSGIGSYTFNLFIYSLNSLFFVVGGYNSSGSMYSSICTFYYKDDTVGYKINYGNYQYLLNDVASS